MLESHWRFLSLKTLPLPCGSRRLTCARLQGDRALFANTTVQTSFRPPNLVVPMKCQKCDKTATFHITELAGGKPQELHLCEEHARQYLTQADEDPTPTTNLAGALAQQLAVGKTAEDLAQLDQKACTVCGITFYEFRNQGRLGCPHDYVFFEKELEPLVVNIHGETEHTGKQPRKYKGGTDRRTDLIRLRREIKAAVAKEDYERASKLRDEIRKIEQSAGEA